MAFDADSPTSTKAAENGASYFTAPDPLVTTEKAKAVPIHKITSNESTGFKVDLVHIEDVQPLGKKPTKKQRLRRHCLRFWFCYLVGLIIFLAIFLPLFFLKIIPALAQLLVNDTDLPIYGGEIKALSNDEIAIGLQTSLTIPGGLSVRLDPLEMWLYNKDTPDFSPYTMVPLDGQNIKGKTDINIQGTVVRVGNRTELNKWLNSVLRQERADISVRANTTAHLGALNFGVNLQKTVNVNALDTLEGFKLEGARVLLPAEEDGTNLIGNLTLPNWSNLTIGLGNLTFNAWAGTYLVGSTSVLDVLLPPGNTTLPFRGQVFLPVLLENLVDILASQSQALTRGQLEIGLSGNSTMVNGEHITYIENVLNELHILSPVPLMQLLTDVLKSVMEGNVDLGGLAEALADGLGPLLEGILGGGGGDGSGLGDLLGDLLGGGDGNTILLRRASVLLNRGSGLPKQKALVAEVEAPTIRELTSVISATHVEDVSLKADSDATIACQPSWLELNPVTGSKAMQNSSIDIASSNIASSVIEASPPTAVDTSDISESASTFEPLTKVVHSAMPTKTFTVHDVSRHNKATDIWLIVDRDVYDVTDFQHEHPGGVKSFDRGQISPSQRKLPYEKPHIFDTIREPVVIREMTQDCIYLLGGHFAILCQFAHPRLAEGSFKHSNFANRIMNRLRTTSRFLYAATLGSSAEKDAVFSVIHAKHSEVKGDTYDADDPELHMWTAATLFMSLVLVHEAFFGKLSYAQMEVMYKESAVYGTSLRMPPDMWPKTLGEFRAYWDHNIETLEVTEWARSLCKDLMYPKNMPWWYYPNAPTTRLLTKHWLPERLQREYHMTPTVWSTAMYHFTVGYGALVWTCVPKSLKMKPSKVYIKDMKRAVQLIEETGTWHETKVGE
ncbi:hypothetical protein HJFPF1_12212 [Paramyrothecium foliicola]|nr:hypothetical protein HJFPF1_12212 [Paramyrothecium foliicola]